MHVLRLSGDSLQFVERSPATRETTKRWGGSTCSQVVEHRGKAVPPILIHGLPPIVQPIALPEVPLLRVVSHRRSSGDHHQLVTGAGRDEYTLKGVPMAQHQVTDKKLDQLMDRLPVSPETRPAPAQIRSLLPYAPAQLVEQENALTAEDPLTPEGGNYDFGKERWKTADEKTFSVLKETAQSNRHQPTKAEEI